MVCSLLRALYMRLQSKFRRYYDGEIFICKSEKDFKLSLNALTAPETFKLTRDNMMENVDFEIYRVYKVATF